MDNPIDKMEVTFICRFHPTDSFHEVGCPHKKWTVDEVLGALVLAKKTIAYHFELFKKHPEILKEEYQLQAELKEGVNEI